MSSIFDFELLSLDLLLGDVDGAHQRLGRVDVGGRVLLDEVRAGGLPRGRVFRDVEVGGDAGQHHVISYTGPCRPERKQCQSLSSQVWSDLTSLRWAARFFSC